MAIYMLTTACVKYFSIKFYTEQYNDQKKKMKIGI